MLFVTSIGTDGGTNLIYNNVKKWIDDIEDITGIRYDKLNVHSFRHCFVENMMRGTHWICKENGLGPVPLEKVKTLCHHESSDTTLHYADNNEERDIEELFGWGESEKDEKNKEKC